MKSIKKPLSLVLSALIFISILVVPITASAVEDSAAGFYLVGSEEVCGVEWGYNYPDETGTPKLTLSKDGTFYYYVAENVPASTNHLSDRGKAEYEFKVIYCTDEGEIYWHPGGMGNNTYVTVDQDGSSLVFKFTLLASRPDKHGSEPEAVTCDVYAPDEEIPDVDTVTAVTYRYSVLDDGTAEITGYSGTETQLEIPDVIDGYKVTSIGYDAFHSEFSKITSVVIPEGVTNIGACAFEFCGNIVNITIPDTVTSIGVRAFASCGSLTSINIPDSVIEIDSEAFADCSNLKTVKLPCELERINSFTFYDCSSLKDIEIPESVSRIGKGAFLNCPLSSISLPQNIQDIDYYALGYKYTGIYGVEFEYFDGELDKIIALDDFKVYGYSRTEAETYAADNGFEFISIGEKPIDYDEMYYDWDYEYIYRVLTNNTVELLEYCGEDSGITVPSEIDGLEVSSLGEGVFSNLENIKSVTVPSTITNIEGAAFFLCEDLEQINLPDTIEHIGYVAFYGTKYYDTSDNWTNGALYINNYLIDARDLGSEYTVKNGTLTIADIAFSTEADLKVVNIPSSVKNIGIKAIGFYGDNEENTQIADLIIRAYNNPFAESYAEKYGFKLESLDIDPTTPSTSKSEPTSAPTDKPTESVTTEPTEPTTDIPTESVATESTEPATDIPTESVETESTEPATNKPTKPVTTEPTEPTTDKPTESVTTEPQPTVTNPTTPTVKPAVKKKANTLKVTVKNKKVKAKKLKSKKQSVKPLTITKAQGKVTVALVKSGTTKKIRTKVTVSKKGVITLKKGKYKKGTYKIKLKITVKGNAKYKPKTLSKTVKIKIK